MQAKSIQKKEINFSKKNHQSDMQRQFVKNLLSVNNYQFYGIRAEQSKYEQINPILFKEIKSILLKKYHIYFNIIEKSQTINIDKD